MLNLTEKILCSINNKNAPNEAGPRDWMSQVMVWFGRFKVHQSQKMLNF
jgi:hypothetical protein